MGGVPLSSRLSSQVVESTPSQHQQWQRRAADDADDIDTASTSSLVAASTPRHSLDPHVDTFETKDTVIIDLVWFDFHRVSNMP
jgi:hypothetical protein